MKHLKKKQQTNKLNYIVPIYFTFTRR